MARKTKAATASPTPVSAPRKVGMTSATVYDGTGLPPRGGGAGRLTSAPTAKAVLPNTPSGEEVDTVADPEAEWVEPVSSDTNEADDTTPEEGSNG